MEREISAATWLAVSLISLAIVVGIVMLTVAVGNKTKNEAIEYGVDLSDDLESGEIRDLRNTATDMSMASIYSILTRNYQNVTQLDLYNITGQNSTAKSQSIAELDKQSSSLADKTLAGVQTYKANANGNWSINGSNANTVTNYVMVYEVLADKSTLTDGISGRAYLVVTPLASGTWKISIMKYSN